MTIKEKWNEIEMLVEKLRKQIGYVQNTAEELQGKTSGLLEINALVEIENKNEPTRDTELGGQE